ncbi:MAG: TetR family transcriptional regulator [Alphaproteobacteria bacterium]|nr:TetR family transcriptional regulator [Alphaproteobacteria bacterium]
MTQTTSQRWRRRKEARPAELLDAALDVFFEKGFAAARLEDIAARAGVSKGTVYLYFDSKEDVFDALVRAIPQTNVEQVRALAADPAVPADEMLRRVLRLVGLFLRDQRMIKFPRLIVGEAANFPKLAETYKREVIDRGIGTLSSIIERGIHEGRFREVDPKNAAYAALAPLLFTAIWRTTFEQFDSSTFEADGFIEQHVETFLRGIAKESAP